MGSMVSCVHPYSSDALQNPNHPRKFGLRTNWVQQTESNCGVYGMALIYSSLAQHHVYQEIHDITMLPMGMLLLWHFLGQGPQDGHSRCSQVAKSRL
jgi:hypothetical protein